ncbi:MAG: Maf family protein [Planctomycetaceae bacterium]|jgi:septum formation protein|nr:Maf family protein [Planctomycetaceae bacterium]
MNNLPLILASQSPRRQQLLTDAGFTFEVRPPDADVEDDRLPEETPEHYVNRLAIQKANNVAAILEQGLIIACDTVVLCEDRILEKPTDRNNARQMLQFSRGRIQWVLSGLCLLAKRFPEHNGTTMVGTDKTILLMQPITDSEIENYLDSGLWYGKSGAFGYQDRHDWLSIIEGSESNIVGLPMELLHQMLGNINSKQILNMKTN